MQELNKKNEEKIDSKNGLDFINLIPGDDWIFAILVTSPLITSNQLGGIGEIILKRLQLSAHCEANPTSTAGPTMHPAVCIGRRSPVSLSAKDLKTGVLIHSLGRCID